MQQGDNFFTNLSFQMDRATMNEKEISMTYDAGSYEARTRFKIVTVKTCRVEICQRNPDGSLRPPQCAKVGPLGSPEVERVLDWTLSETPEPEKRTLLLEELCKLQSLRMEVQRRPPGPRPGDGNVIVIEYDEPLSTSQIRLSEQQQ